MIYIIVSSFFCLWFLFSCFYVNHIKKSLQKINGKIFASDEKLKSFKEVMLNKNIVITDTIMNFLIEKDKNENYNKLTDGEKNLINISAYGYYKEREIERKLINKKRKIEKLNDYLKQDYSLFAVVKWVLGFLGVVILTISICILSYYEYEARYFKNKIETYSDTTNNVRPYEEDVMEILTEIHHSKDAINNNYLFSFRTKKWLSLNEASLKNIKDTKGFNIVPPRIEYRK